MDKEAIIGHVLSAAKNMAARRYGQLVGLYGPAKAKLIVGSGAAGLVPPIAFLPGSTFLTALPALGFAEATSGAPLTRAGLERLGNVIAPESKGREFITQKLAPQWSEGFQRFMESGKTAAEKRHHVPVITLNRRHGKVMVCPQCGDEMADKDIYKDAKGWYFHRKCFRKGKGAICLTQGGHVKEALTPLQRVAIGAGVGMIPGLIRRKPKEMLVGGLAGAGLGAGSEYVFPSVGQFTPAQPGAPLQRKWEQIKDRLSSEGAWTGTGHQRIVVPHKFLSKKELENLGFIKSRVAVPEAGQKVFATWRHPTNLYHFHEHPGQMWTVHEDLYPSMDMLRYHARTPAQRLFKDIPHGLGHVLIEGVPGYAYYARNRLWDAMQRLTGAAQQTAGKDPTATPRQASAMIQAILEENPRAVIAPGGLPAGVQQLAFSPKTQLAHPLPTQLAKASSAPLPHEKQDTDWSCGAAVLKAVENSMGVDSGPEEQYVTDTQTEPDDGTAIVHLEQAAANHGLGVSSSGEMSLEDLQQAVGAGKPVIVAVQLDGPEGGPPGGWGAGHYVVVTGMDNDKVEFMDPNSDQQRRYWPIQEFVQRWHDHDHQGKTYNQWGMTLHHPAEKGGQFSTGALGSGYGDGRGTTDPPRLVDASGATPAGPENQPATFNEQRNKKLLEEHDQLPDPNLFDTALLDKMGIEATDLMSVGTEESQEPADDLAVGHTGRHHRPHAVPNIHQQKLREAIVKAPSYQDSGTVESQGRSSRPTQVGAPTADISSGQYYISHVVPSGMKPAGNAVDQDVKMELDSTTPETGPLKHLWA